MKISPIKAICLGCLLGISCVALIGAGLTKWVGQFYGDGGGLSNIVASAGAVQAITNAAGYLGVDGTMAFTNANAYVKIAPGGLLSAYEIRAGELGSDTAPGAGIIRGQFFGDGSHITNSPAVSWTNVVDRSQWPTNLNDGVNIDPNTSGRLFITNASFNISGFQNKLSTFNYEFTMTYSNSAATSITIGGPPNAHYIGTSSTNSLILAAGKEADYWFQVRPNRTNVLCAAEQ